MSTICATLREGKPFRPQELVDADG